MRVAIIYNNVVDNVITAESVEDVIGMFPSALVVQTDAGNPGDVYNPADNSFTAPVVSASTSWPVSLGTILNRASEADILEALRSVVAVDSGDQQWAAWIQAAGGDPSAVLGPV